MRRAANVHGGDIKGGERYTANCPFCGGVGKLWLSYMVERVPVDTVKHGRGYVNCYRCEFQRDRDKLGEFMANLMLVMDGGPSDPGFVVDIEVEEDTRPPPHLFKLSDPGTELFRDYLARRNFRWEELEEEWGVRCSADRAWFRTGRLVVPIRDVTGREVSWQARHIDGPMDEWEQKYLFPPGVPKGGILYNADRAIHTRGVVAVCEGVFDVFRVGAGGVALFGKAASDTQRRMLGTLFRGRDLVVLLDNEKGARDEAARLRDTLEASGSFKSVRDVYFKDGDPADHTREEVEALINLTKGKHAD